jgi:hypothetical protein
MHVEYWVKKPKNTKQLGFIFDELRYLIRADTIPKTGSCVNSISDLGNILGLLQDHK